MHRRRWGRTPKPGRQARRSVAFVGRVSMSRRFLNADVPAGIAMCRYPLLEERRIYNLSLCLARIGGRSGESVVD